MFLHLCVFVFVYCVFFCALSWEYQFSPCALLAITDCALWYLCIFVLCYALCWEYLPSPSALLTMQLEQLLCKTDDAHPSMTTCTTGCFAPPSTDSAAGNRFANSGRFCRHLHNHTQSHTLALQDIKVLCIFTCVYLILLPGRRPICKQWPSPPRCHRALSQVRGIPAHIHCSFH